MHPVQQSKVKIIQTFQNGQWIQYEKKKVNKSLYNNPHLNNLLKIQKNQNLNSIDSNSIIQINPTTSHNSFDESDKISKIESTVENDHLKNSSRTFYIWILIIQVISSLAQISLQIVLLVYNTPLNKISTGIWSGTLGILIFFLILALLIKQKNVWYTACLIINVIGLFVFISLIIINSLILSLYDTCSLCNYNSNYIGINIALMVLGLVSFTACVFFILKLLMDKR